MGNHHGKEKFTNLSVLHQFDQWKGFPATLAAISNDNALHGNEAAHKN
jgi:hypothetical protein